MKQFILIGCILVLSGVARADYGVTDDPTVTGTDGYGTQSDPTTTGTDRQPAPLVLAEDASMRQTEPNFICTGRVLKTQAGRISLIEVKLDASRITRGAIKDQFGTVHTPAFSVTDYLVAFKAPSTETAVITEQELTAECEAVALARGWRAALTISTQKMVDEL